MSDKLLQAVPLFTSEELGELMLFNDTAVPYPKFKTLNILFEEQVLLNPDHVALKLGSKSMTYRELNSRANQLARGIIELGVQPGDPIGLLTERNFEMIIGMYAILKAGGAYVPVDPDYPIERQKYILSDAAVSLLITDTTYEVIALMPDLMTLDCSTVLFHKYKANNLKLSIDSHQLAYIIYTSGSTGKPKGVMIEHHSAVNLILWVNNRFKVGVNDRLLFITSMCFDLSVYDIFGILSAGGSVVIAEQAQVNDFNQLLYMLKHDQITFWNSVPSTLDYLVRELEATRDDYNQNDLRLVFLSGDWIPIDLSERIKKFFPEASVISLGGATEATVWSNYFPIEKLESSWNSIPYGKPIANNFFYILNDELQPVPIGVKGELFIGGVGVARGYANNVEKTVDSFLADPFNTDYGGKMYRTGDQGRMMPGLNMEFLGRKDDQVKIRGFRVELGEIEHLLHQCEHLKCAVVLAKMNKHGQKELIGFVVPIGKFEKDGVIEALKLKLSDYMIPSIWVDMQNLPLTINGKIDRKALLDIEIPEVARLPTKAVTPLEKTMTRIWKEIFGMGNIGTEDNFFELGGHSLMAIQIMAHFEKETGIKLPAVRLYRNPTVLSLLNSIGDNNVEKKSQALVPKKSISSNHGL